MNKNNTSDYITMMELLTQHFGVFATKGTWDEEDREEWKAYRKFVSEAQTHLRSITVPREVKQERSYQHLLESTEQRAKEQHSKLVKGAANFSLRQQDKSRYGSLMDKYLS